MKKYLVNFKWVEIDPKKITLLDSKTGTYNLTLNQMLNNGGTVLWQGNVQVDTDNVNKIFMLSRFKATVELNNLLQSRAIVQNTTKTTLFVVTNVREIKTAVKLNSIGGNSIVADNFLESEFHLNAKVAPTTPDKDVKEANTVAYKPTFRDKYGPFGIVIPVLAISSLSAFFGYKYAKKHNESTVAVVATTIGGFVALPILAIVVFKLTTPKNASW